MPLFLKSIDPDIDIFGNRQSFHFNHEETPDDNKGFYSLVNHFTPTASTPLQSSLDLLDKNLSGFRLFHEQGINEIYGNFSLQKHSVFGQSEDIFKYEEANDKVTFLKEVEFSGGGGGGGSDVTLTGAVSGSGVGTVNTLLNNYISQTIEQTFNFTSGNSNFNLFFPNTGGNGVKLRMGREISTSTGLFGFELNSTTLPNGEPVFKLSFSGIHSVYDIFHVSSNIPIITFNNYRVTGVADPINFNDVATKAYVDSVSGSGGTSSANSGTSFASNDINVNTNGGSNNWLRRNNVTKTGVSIYGLNSSTSSFLLESNSGESAGIGVAGNNDACTIWTAGDSGSYLNIQDEDRTNNRVAYVNDAGAWTQVSSRTRKHSIADKINNNVLDRFLRLSVKSYGYEQEKRKNSSKLREARIEKKANKMHIGLILEELFEVFPNCIPDYYNSLFQDKGSKKNLDLKEEIKDISNSGIDYNVLLCYFIMAFQEYAKKTNNEIVNLKKLLNKEGK